MTDSLALYSARRGLGILGGTFDPVHAGHLCLAIDTVSRLREEVGPDMPLVLILGSDQWFNLSTWREWQSLTDFVHIAYCARDGVRESEIPESQALWAAPRMTESSSSRLRAGSPASKWCLTALAPPPSAARLPENPLPAPCRRSTAGSTPALPPTSGRTDSISPRAINLK